MLGNRSYNNCVFFQVEKKVGPAHTLYGKLFWREFFYTAATNNPNFNRMSANKNCVQIPWDKNPTAVAKWAEVCMCGSIGDSGC